MNKNLWREQKASRHWRRLSRELRAMREWHLGVRAEPNWQKLTADLEAHPDTTATEALRRIGQKQ